MKKGNKKTAAIAGVGLALGAAALAAGYLFSGERGAKNRKAVKGWMLKAKGEVLEQIERAKNIDEASYRKIVDGIARRYRAIRGVDRDDLARMVNELQSHWKRFGGKPKRSPGKAKSGAKKKSK